MASNIPNPWDKDYEGAQLSPIYEPLWHMLQMFLQSVPFKKVLDFGCGDGRYSFLMKEEGFQVTGIDISPRAIEKAITYRNSCKDERSEFFRQDSIPDDFPNDSFGVVVMLNSLHCLTHKERSNTLIQVKRVLKGNGYLFASVLALEDESYPRQGWKEVETNTFDDGTGKKFHFFSFDELVDELKGLRISESRVLQNIHPEVGRKSVLFVVTAKKAE
jgi:SAM-dependent methyltransferase